MHGMKHLRMGMAALAAMLLLPLAVTAAPRTWVIDPEHFSIAFSVEHAGFADVMGLFQEAEGQFVYDPETRELESGEVTVRAKSVFSAHKERDKHVRDGDFLDGDAHPEIRFVATGYEPEGEDRGALRGDLTLLGETRPVTLDVRINRVGEYPFGGGLRRDHHPAQRMGYDLRRRERHRRRCRRAALRTRGAAAGRGLMFGSR